MERLKLTTGLKQYEIYDENDNLRGTISFNPSDVNFVKRADTSQKKIQGLIKEAEELAKKVPEDNEVDGVDGEIIKEIESIDNTIKQELNYMFDSDVSTVVFGNQHCLNPLNGVTFVERFLNMVTPAIEKEVKKESKASEARKAKYTSRYKK